MCLCIEFVFEGTSAIYTIYNVCYSTKLLYFSVYDFLKGLKILVADSNIF